MKEVESSKQRKLTLKQRKWIKEYIKTGNATEAAVRVYDVADRDSARAIGSENLAKLAFNDLMEEMGLTDVALVNVGAEGMVAKRSTITGEMVPDYAVRHKYWETFLKLKKRLGPEVVNNTQINANEMTLEFS
jgi:L-serine deaminase